MELIVKETKLHPQFGTVYVISLEANNLVPLRSEAIKLMGTEVTIDDVDYVVTNIDALGAEFIHDNLNLLLKRL